MNGWQRLGIVLSVLWAMSVLGYAYFESRQVNMTPFRNYEQVPVGAWERSMTMYLVRIERSSLGASSPYSLIQKYHAATSEEERVEIRKQIDIVNQSTYSITPTSLLAELLFGPLTALWLLAYVSLAIWRWIAAGFRISR